MGHDVERAAEEGERTAEKCAEAPPAAEAGAARRRRLRLLGGIAAAVLLGVAAAVAIAVLDFQGGAGGAPATSPAATLDVALPSAAAPGVAEPDVEAPVVEKPVVGVTMARVSLAEADPKAVCNNGEPAAYYRRLAPNSSSWFVWLEGGGWCWSNISCHMRSKRKTADVWRGESLHFSHGVWDPASPVSGFNIIYVPYCSSDAHLGDVAAEDNVAGMPLRGARIVRAAMRHAMAARPGGISAGNLVVFGGVSAGGRGALVHLDTLVPYGVLPEGVRLLGFLDSVDYMEMPTFHGLDSWGHNVTKQTRGVMSLMHNEEFLAGGGACDLEDVWKCAFGEHRLRLLRTPFLLAGSMYDEYQLWLATGKNCCPYPSPQEEYFAFSNSFANHTREQVLQLPQVGSGTAGIFLTSCYDHGLSKHTPFLTETVLGVSMAQALQQAIDFVSSQGGQKATPMPRVVEPCTGLHCGSGCSKRMTLPEDRFK